MPSMMGLNERSILESSVSVTYIVILYLPKTDGCSLPKLAEEALQLAGGMTRLVFVQQSIEIWTLAKVSLVEPAGQSKQEKP